MKIHSLKLTLQDAETKDKKMVAAIFGTVFIDNDEYKTDSQGFVFDEAGQKIPIYETINFTTALDNVEHFKQVAQELIIEALTLKNMKIAKENGQLSHFIESVTDLDQTPKQKPKGFRKTIADVKAPKKNLSERIVEARKKTK